jgi:hypothetical protein
MRIRAADSILRAVVVSRQTYVLVLLVEAVVIAALYWVGRHFA